MKCPVDGTTLQLAERANIEIDYCPDCRGIWLDRGELDKLIDRGSVPASPPPAPPTTTAPHTEAGGPPSRPTVSAAGPAGPPTVQSAAMDALRAVRELADAHKRKGNRPGFL